MSREYNTPIVFDEFTWLYTAEGFIAQKEAGVIISDWGNGYWVKDDRESEDNVFSTPREDATHVSWYNK